MPEIKKILVPTDFSDNASVVFDHVRKTAEKYEARVDLIHIIPDFEYLKVSHGVWGDPYDIQNNYGKLKEELTERLKETFKKEIPEKYRGQTFIKDDTKAVQGIIACDKEEGYDLIIIGSRGLGDSIFNRGSVTQKLIRLSKTPVLSVTHQSDPEIKTIVVPTDGSKISMKALPIALNFADKYNADIHLLSVSKFDYDIEKLVGRDARIYEYALERLKDDVSENLKDFINHCDQFSFTETPSAEEAVINLDDENEKSVRISIKLEEGASTHNTIVNYAEENAELVVMATHGRTGLSKLLIGSIAEKVIHHLEIPVLTIKPELKG